MKLLVVKESFWIGASNCCFCLLENWRFVYHAVSLAFFPLMRAKIHTSKWNWNCKLTLSQIEWGTILLIWKLMNSHQMDHGWWMMMGGQNHFFHWVPVPDLTMMVRSFSFFYPLCINEPLSLTYLGPVFYRAGYQGETWYPLWLLCS